MEGLRITSMESLRISFDGCTFRWKVMATLKLKITSVVFLMCQMRNLRSCKLNSSKTLRNWEIGWEVEEMKG